jgi:DNA-binding transcriptional regulator YiaG
MNHSPPLWECQPRFPFLQYINTLVENSRGVETADEIKEIRVFLGWSQRELADYIGVDVMTVSRPKRGLHEPQGTTLYT